MKLQILKLILVFLSVIMLVGCSKKEDGQTQTNQTAANSNSFTVILGSELKGLENYKAEIKEKTGLNIEFKFVGTLEANDIISEQKYDSALFANDAFLVADDKQNFIIQKEKLFYSPIAIGIRKDMINTINSKDNIVEWKELISKIDKLPFALTNPTASNSGLSTLIAIATSTSKKGELSNVNDIDENVLKKFFSFQRLTSGSSGWLAEQYLKEIDRIPMIFNYEASLKEINKLSGDKLKIFYPKETITASYPFMLLKKDKQADYAKLLAYFKSKDFQNKFYNQHFFRPSNQDIKINEPTNFIDVNIPINKDILTGIMFLYLDKIKTKQNINFVIDTSGSMSSNNGLENIKNAINDLAGDDKSFGGKLVSFQSNESLYFTLFNSVVQPVQTFLISKSKIENENVKKYSNEMKANGGTAIDLLRNKLD